MKINVFLILSLVIFIQGLSAQSLSDIYRKGTVKLIADREYGRDNNWEKVFESYYDTIYNRPMGNRKSIVMLPDQSIVVSHEYRNLYSLFGPDGKFVREFSLTGISGKPLKKTNKIKGIIGNHFFTGLDNLGRMMCFDFEGRYVKTLTLDYMAKDMIPLSDDKIAVVGWAIWKDKFRDFVALVDYQTNEQKIIWDHFSKPNGSWRPAYDYTSPKIAFLDSQLIVALPQNGEIMTFDLEGRLITKDHIEWESRYMSVEEQKKSARKSYEILAKNKPVNLSGEFLKKVNDYIEKIILPFKLPAFLTIIKDSDNNLLFFEIPEKEEANIFHVRTCDAKRQFIAQSSFECEEYNLSITSDKMIFHEGFIYALQVLKNSEGNPLRLVRFKLSD